MSAIKDPLTEGDADAMAGLFYRLSAAGERLRTSGARAGEHIERFGLPEVHDPKRWVVETIRREVAWGSMLREARRIRSILAELERLGVS